MVEYLVAAVIVFGLFALPVEDGQPLIVVFLDAVKAAYANFSAAISVP